MMEMRKKPFDNITSIIRLIKSLLPCLLIFIGFNVGSKLFDVLFLASDGDTAPEKCFYSALNNNVKIYQANRRIIDLYIHDTNDANANNERKKGKSEPKSDMELKSSKRLFDEMLPSQKNTFWAGGWKNAHRFIRACRKMGWKKLDNASEARIVYCDTNDPKFHRDRNVTKSWQRYNHLPNSTTNFAYHSNFIDGWRRYQSVSGSRNAYFLPEMYRLFHSNDRKMLRDRFVASGDERKEKEKGIFILHHMGVEPYLFKIQREAFDFLWNLQPNSSLTADNTPGDNPQNLQDPQNDINKNVIKTNDQSWIGEYICNQMKWHDGQNMVIRVLWLVASLDPLMVFYQDGFVRIGVDEFEHIANYYVDKAAVPFDQLESYLSLHASTENGKKLPEYVRNDPFGHVRNQMKEAISILVDAFANDVFTISSSPSKEEGAAEDAFELFAADFVIDDNMDVWLMDVFTDTPVAPDLNVINYYTFLMEDYYFLLEKNHFIFYGMLRLLNEIWEKQSKHANILPLKNAGQWEIVVARESRKDGTSYDTWSYNYKQYHNRRRKKKDQNCVSPIPTEDRKYDSVGLDDDWIPEWTLHFPENQTNNIEQPDANGDNDKITL